MDRFWRFCKDDAVRVETSDEQNQDKYQSQVSGPPYMMSVLKTL